MLTYGLKERGHSVFRVLYWTGPIGVGIFLHCHGAMLQFIAKAKEIEQRTKRSEEDSKGRE